ncbi:MAG: TraX family protein [Faecousia sp.]
MKKQGISQETLKLIACVTMLIDHVGATIVLEMYRHASTGANAWTLYQIYLLMRIIGRIAFPIYCFLLAEGTHYTKNPKKYALRLAIGAVLSELPFDFAFWGSWTWEYQSVMLTMLMGFFALEAMEKCKNRLLKIVVMLPFALLAEWMQTDYGGAGVVMIALFGMTRELPHRWLFQLAGTALIIYTLIPSWFRIGQVRIPLEMFGLIALIPIALYSGRKATSNKAVQWGFYLFYPVHLTALCLISRFVG